MGNSSFGRIEKAGLNLRDSFEQICSSHTRFELGEKPTSPLELGVFVGDGIIDKANRGEPIRSLVVEVVVDRDGHPEVPLTDFYIGLNVGLETDTTDPSVEGFAHRLAEITGHPIAVELVEGANELTPDEQIALTPTNPVIASISDEITFPAIRIRPVEG